jgi:predicted helicase
VFDIRQGTAIALFIKTKDTNSENGKKVFHSELWGMRKEKYDWLIDNDITTTKWQKITPKSEFYLFVPRDERLLSFYQDFPQVTWIFPLHSLGFVNH